MICSNFNFCSFKRGDNVLKDKELLTKGHSSFLVLSVIEKEDMYGYQIARKIEKLSEDVFSMKEGTLYPILHSFEKDGLVEAYWVLGENERKRKYYRITNKGIKELEKSRKEWETYSDAVNKVAYGGTINATA